MDFFIDETTQDVTDSCYNEPSSSISTPIAMKKSSVSSMKEADKVLSPIGEISMNLSNTELNETPRSLADKNNFEYLNTFEESTTDANFAEIKNSLMNNTFLNSGGRSPTARRAEAHARSVQRRLVHTPRNPFDENLGSPGKSNMSCEDVSFYGGNSPQGSPRPCSISPCMEMGLMSPEKSTSDFSLISNTDVKSHVFPDIECNSLDSGYERTNDSRNFFKFAEPSGMAPKRTPPKTTSTVLKMSPKSTSCFRPFNSLSSDSMDSMDDEYLLDLDSFESMDDDIQKPADFSSIISGDIKSTPDLGRPPIRRTLSVTTPSHTNRVRSAIFEPKTPEENKSIVNNVTPYSSRIENGGRGFKRPDTSFQNHSASKRHKYDGDEKENVDESQPKPRIFRKSMSLNDANIMSALARSSSEPDLIGDFSKPFCLPLTEGRHSDLKSISQHTMAKLLSGDYDDSVVSYKIIDCRYPYEFEGGHIRGAKNIYRQEDILNELVNSKTETANVATEELKRNIIVFHCEFSSERGPKLSRFLRNQDRLCNTNVYPALYYPEIYLLHGGYKEFFETYANLCEPNTYRTMLDPSYETAYRHFRAQAKSWSGDTKTTGGGPPIRFGKSRSRLVL